MPSVSLVDELRIRTAAMSYVADISTRAGGVVTRRELEAFTYDGQQLKLIDQSRGIRNPAALNATLSVLSSDSGPYSDAVLPNGRLRYDYRTGAVDAGDNRKLRESHRLQLPIIYLRTISPAIFVPTLPVTVAADNVAERFVELDLSAQPLDTVILDTSAVEGRSYAERLTRLRLHQPVFRARVLAAYDKACVICQLRHVQLLDAAHILSDAEGGQPEVSNGLALCKIHHSAYDADIMGIDADSRVHVRLDILAEVDGPMLRHGIQELDGARLRQPERPADRPRRELLKQRFDRFLSA